MRFFKYLFFIFLLLIPTLVNSAVVYRTYGGFTGSTPTEACKKWRTDGVFKSVSTYTYPMIGECKSSTGGTPLSVSSGSCPSAQSVDLKVPVNAQTYQCVKSCQYRLRACVDIDFEPGMTCSAISTGAVCGQTKPPEPPKPTDPIVSNPDTDIEQPKPAENTSNSQSTSTGTSTSTATTTTNQNNTTTTTNTTTNNSTTTNTTINLDRLEQLIKNMTSILSSKLDSIKEALGGDSGSENGTPDGTDLTETNKKLDDIKNNGDKLNNWLQGKNEDGTGGGVGDNPFGTDVTPERTLDAQSFKTNIFQSNAQCPADKTLSMTLFTGRTFSRTLSFSMWCDKLAIFGSLILIAAYLYGASIIVRNS